MIHSIGLDLTPDGSTVVGYYYTTELRTKPTIWNQGGAAFLPFPPGFDGSARAVSSNGIAVGSLWGINGEPGGAARWSPELQLLSAPSGLTDSFVATDVSETGAVIVGYGFTNEALSPIRWVNGVPTLLGSMNTGSITRVSDDGWRVVAGTYVWDPVVGWRSFASILASAGLSFPSGWTGDGAIDISADGTTILGGSLNAQGRGVAWTLRIPPFCYANCDGSSVSPALNVLDFHCFLNKFVASDLYADCNLDGATNVLDFNCFLNKFVQGCP